MSDIVDFAALAKLIQPYKDANGADPVHPTNLYGHATWLRVELERVRIAVELLQVAMDDANQEAYKCADEAHKARRDLTSRGDNQ